MGAYAILARADVFGNAQTSNLIHIAMCILGHNTMELMLRVGGLLIYISGVCLAALWPKFTKVSVHFLAVVIDGIVFVILGFLPKDMNILAALYPIFFAAAFQWTAFTGVYGYSCSTIFSTNNLKQFVIGITEYIYSRDKKQLHKALFYGEVLLFYHAGVGIEFVIYKFFGIHSAWFGIIFAVMAAGLVIYENTENDKREVQKLKSTCA